MTQSSTLRFRFIFFTLILLLLISLGLSGWLAYKCLPNIKIPFLKKKETEMPEIPPNP